MNNRAGFVAVVAIALLLAPSPAYAHLGHCTNGEAASTILVSGALAVLLFRPWKKVSTMSARITRLTLPLVLAVAVTATGCGGSKSSTTKTTVQQHPASQVRIQITQPTPNQVTGSNVTLVVNLIGGQVVPAAQTKISGNVPTDQGHIHVSLDGTLVNMAYSTTQDLNGLKPGQHTLTAEFVAIDHLPFQNRPTAAVIFNVQ